MVKYYFTFLLLLPVCCTAQPPATGTVKRFTNVVDSYPMLSQDGTKIVFQSNRTGSWEIFSMHAAGSHLKQLTNNAIEDVTPCGSPDGKRVVYASNRYGPANVGQLVMYTLESKITLPVSTGPISHVQPAFSVDGKKLVAYEVIETAAYEFGGIVLIDLN